MLAFSSIQNFLKNCRLCKLIAVIWHPLKSRRISIGCHSIAVLHRFLFVLNSWTFVKSAVGIIWVLFWAIKWVMPTNFHMQICIIIPNNLEVGWRLENTKLRNTGQIAGMYVWVCGGGFHLNFRPSASYFHFTMPPINHMWQMNTNHMFCSFFILRCSEEQQEGYHFYFLFLTCALFKSLDFMFEIKTDIVLMPRWRVFHQ